MESVSNCQHPNQSCPKIFIKIVSFLFLWAFYSTPALSQIVQTFNSSGTFTVPAGVTFVTVECWGGGGGSGGVNSKQSVAGGGSGGAYTKGIISVTPGSGYSYTVGAGGSGGSGVIDGGSGGTTWFGSANTIAAVGGTGGKSVTTGTQNTPVAGLGGVAPTSGNVGGSVNFYGGNGGAGSTVTKISGGGGGSAGIASNGNAANGTTGGTAVAGGSAGVDGISGDNVPGRVGNVPGGGASGSSNTTGQNTTAGAAGGVGQIRLTYCITYTLSTTSVSAPVCSGSSPTVLVTSSAVSLPVDVYTVTYNITGANTATGQTATMNVTTAGSGSFTTANLSNAGNSTITITNLSTNSAGCSSPITANNTAAVTVDPVNPITAQPSPATQTLCQNAAASQLSVTASGAGLTYQWYRNDLNNNTNGVLITGATSATYTPATNLAGSMYYYVVVRSNCGTSTSNTVVINVNKATAITTQPSTAGQTLCENTSATALSVVATGTGTLGYQWYSNTTGSNTGGTLISGATSSSYTPVTATAGTLYYYVVVTGSCSPTSLASSVSGAITVTPSAKINTQPAGATYCQNTLATALTVSATGTGTLTYQWYSNTTNSNAGGTAVGTNSNSYTPTTTAAGTVYYYVSVTGNCSTAVSNTAAIAVNAATVISSQPSATQTLCQNAAATPLSVSATGTGTLTYQWYSNGQIIIQVAPSSVVLRLLRLLHLQQLGTVYYYVIVYRQLWFCIIQYCHGCYQCNNCYQRQPTGQRIASLQPLLHYQ